MMDILQDKIVKTRKDHTCHMCLTRIKKGSEMKSTTVVDDDIYTSRICMICNSLLADHDHWFLDDDNMLTEGVTLEVMSEFGAYSPQDLLNKLNN